MKVFRDPVHNFISFRKKEDKAILEIINTPEFQRLRRIRQLGFSCYTYPTATHDRFSHSLGVAYVVGLLFDSLNIDSKTQLSATDGTVVDLSKDELKLLVQLAGLLHDIGHGPFSHAFEKITSVKHEEMSKRIILNEEGNILRILRNIEINDKRIKENFPYWITQIITKGAFAPTWVKQLISGQLDADRIDYLLRDAYMCGVSYASFDIKWLFHNIEIGENSDREKCLVINADKSVHAVEAFIISRYHMYEQVYLHKTTRCMEVIMHKVFERVKDLCENGEMQQNDFLCPELYKLITKSEVSIEEYLILDDFCIYTQFNNWIINIKDRFVKDLCEAIIYRKPYKMIGTTDDYRKKEYDIIDNFFSSFVPEGSSDVVSECKDYYFLEDNLKNIPYQDSYAIGEKSADQADLIWVKKGEKSVELSTVSAIVESLKNKELKRTRAYVHRSCSSQLETKLKS